MFNTLQKSAGLLIDLIYPRFCAACEEVLQEKEKHICYKCRFTLPRTHFYKHRENDTAKILWGRLPFENAASWLFFNKSTRVQKLLHNIKYKGCKEAAELSGKWCGYDLRDAGFTRGIDHIIPVPLHPVKEKKRGYNQSEWIGKGLQSSSKIEMLCRHLFRIKDSDTQTRKSRYQRWENVEEIFSIENSEALENKHLLLIDDVLTTGATLEACGQQLLKIPGVKLSVFTLAYAARN